VVSHNHAYPDSSYQFLARLTTAVVLSVIMMHWLLSVFRKIMIKFQRPPRSPLLGHFFLYFRAGKTQSLIQPLTKI
jgi:hypothetical protein